MIDAGGAVVGYIGGIVMRVCMRFMRLHGSSPDRELALSLAGAYLTFYIANAPRALSVLVSANLSLSSCQHVPVSFHKAHCQAVACWLMLS